MANEQDRREFLKLGAVAVGGTATGAGLIVGCDSVAQLEENVRIACAFNPLSPGQMAALETKAETVHQQALFFRRWT